MSQNHKKSACLALSGGMDSSSLLLHLLAKKYEVYALSFLYGQKHDKEIECAQDLTQHLTQAGFAIHHHIIRLDGLENLLFSALVKGGDAVPQGHYSSENMKATVVPNRNKVFISILQSVALSVALRTQEKTLVAMGIHAGDYVVYPDCRQSFVEQDFFAFQEGNHDANLVANYLPYINMKKVDVLQDGLLSCEALGLDFDDIYKRTLTSYNPDNMGVSDYKSASSIQRIEAFLALNRKDPIQYADETGLVDWKTVTDYVLGL